MINKKVCEDVILALDVASRKTGYAIYKNGKIIKSGTWKLGVKWRKDLFEKIDYAIEDHNVTEIIAEDIYKSDDNRYQSAYRVLSQCSGIVECVAEFWSLPKLSYIRPIGVKQHMWNMRYGQKITREEQKERMIRAVIKLGYELENDKADDEADAIGLLITYLETYKYPIRHPDKQPTEKCAG
jgi:Holliday junction resolvasome RuvABC endonuclease subunit